MGDVRNEGGNLAPLLRQAAGGGGGAVQKPGQLGFQGGGGRLVEGGLLKLPLQGPVQHAVHLGQLPPGPEPLDQPEEHPAPGQEQAEHGKSVHHQPSAHT